MITKNKNYLTKTTYDKPCAAILNDEKIAIQCPDPRCNFCKKFLREMIEGNKTTRSF